MRKKFNTSPWNRRYTAHHLEELEGRLLLSGRPIESGQTIEGSGAESFALTASNEEHIFFDAQSGSLSNSDVELVPREA